MRILTIFSLFLLGSALSFTISSVSSAQTRSDYLGAYRDWMLPTSHVDLNQAQTKTKSLTAKVYPRRDFSGLAESEEDYGAYLEWILPTRNLGLGTATTQPKHATVKTKPRTDYDHGNSGSFYDFYLDWMTPRIKPKSPRIIRFLTFIRSYEKGQAVSKNK